MIGTDIVISCFIGILICIATSGVDGTCCNFEQVQNGCSDMFQGEENEPLPCTLRTDFPSTDGICQIDKHSQDAGSQDRGLPSNQIQLFATDISWDATCLPSTDVGEDCSLLQRDASFITLDISFTLTGKNIHGIHFDLRTLEGEVEPSVGSLEKSCHFLLLNNSLPNDIIGSRILTYSGFVGLHPGSRYRLKATTMTTNGTFTAFTSKEFSVPDCYNMSKNNSNFFCNLPTPAHWPSTILVSPHNFHVTFTVWPEEGVFNTYFLYLLDGNNIEKNSDIIVKKELKYVTNNIEYQDIDDVNATVMRYTFEGANEKLPPGLYSIAVLPQPDDACTADYHWGRRRCKMTLFPFTHGKLTTSPVTETSSSTKNATRGTVPVTRGSLPATRGSVTTVSTSKVFQFPSVLPTSLQPLRTIFNLLLVFLIICLVCICVWCCNLKIYNGTSIFSSVQDCICGGNVNLDERTVTTLNWLNRYEHVPLDNAIPGRLNSYQSSEASRKDSIASCSDVESGTAM